MQTVALVLAGGIGSRLYPASRGHRPKQFLELGGDESLLARTVARADFADHVVVATRQEFADEAAVHAPDAEILVEPKGKDTGPALAYATHRIWETYGDGGVAGGDGTGSDEGDGSHDEGDGMDDDRAVENLVVVAMPSDHHVADPDAFSETMRAGAYVASETGNLVTFGVTPDRPDTGYGYIEPGTDHGDYRSVRKFHEKPDGATAAEYVDAGYLWNSGLFAWTPESFFEAADDSPLAPLVDAFARDDPESGFDAVDPVSIDYAVMERAENVAVVPADFEWDDLGSWDALERILRRDGDGNVSFGDALHVDAADNVVASDGKHVSLVGVSGLAVVAFDDRVLVVPKGEAQRVREAVAKLKEKGTF
jgi:mannose-1-phosphate guanylyltransferase